MTRPAAPLEKAVAAAERWIDAYGGEEYLSTSGLLHARDSAAVALRLLLAALDADRGEAEAALREVSASPCFCVSYPDPEKTIECGRCIARRYFARREGADVRGERKETTNG